MPKKPAKPNHSSNLGFEETLWAAAADKMRGNMDAMVLRNSILPILMSGEVSPGNAKSG